MSKERPWMDPEILRADGVHRIVLAPLQESFALVWFRADELLGTEEHRTKAAALESAGRICLELSGNLSVQ